MICPGRVFIIAEAGVNHNGSVDRAKELVDVAAAGGADAVKFQTFQADSLVCGTAVKAEYQSRTTDAAESQHVMLKRLELDEAAHRELIRHCRQQRILFLSSPFDLQSAELLTSTLDLPLLKLASGEITNAPLLLRIAQTGKPVILSTGMSTIHDIEAALGVLAFGYLRLEGSPSLAAFQQARRSKEGQHLLRLKVTLLHCTTEYPAPFNEVNLKAIETLAAVFGLPVGLSDHTTGIAVPLAAAALGAAVIEKHFTMDRSLPGPDHQASLEPDELYAMVRGIRQIEKALGTSDKVMTPSECNNRHVARKSLVASRPISKGDLFTYENLTAKRPGSGISPMHYWECLGKPAQKDYQRDELVDLCYNP